MIVANHVTRRAVFNTDFIVLHAVRDKKIYDMDVSRTFGAGSLAILFKFHSTFIVLVADVVLQAISLCL